MKTEKISVSILLAVLDLNAKGCQTAWMLLNTGTERTDDKSIGPSGGIPDGPVLLPVGKHVIKESAG